jgi:hypothetical protein
VKKISGAASVEYDLLISKFAEAKPIGPDLKVEEIEEGE